MSGETVMKLPQTFFKPLGAFREQKEERDSLHER